MSERRWSKTATQYEKATDHYDEAYFLDQTRHGLLRGKANAWKFSPFTGDAEKILDFGCGDGALLHVLGGKYGVEVNPSSACEARKRDLVVVSGLDDLNDIVFDVVISNHCFEHLENPFEELRKIRKILRPGGTLVIVVPCHRADFPYAEADRDYHLYSWSPANLGNLVKLAGFEILCCKELKHRWPPKWPIIIEKFGLTTFHNLSLIWARLNTQSSQVRCVARAPN